MPDGTVALGLPGLFLVCVQYFELVQLGRSFKADFGSCAVRLKAAHLHLLRWGASADITDKEALEAKLSKYGPSELETAKELLQSIHEQFDRAQKDSSGLKRRIARANTVEAAKEVEELDVSEEIERAEPKWSLTYKAMDEVKVKYSKLSAAIGDTKDRARWALYDRKHLTTLVDEVPHY